MGLLSDSKNEEAWESTKKIRKSKLEALFHLLKEEKLIDSVYIDNIPFSRNGKITFIGTEHYHSDEKTARYVSADIPIGTQVSCVLGSTHLIIFHNC